jgi:diguanylate cyclase (GGDEF)-like protein
MQPTLNGHLQSCAMKPGDHGVKLRVRLWHSVPVRLGLGVLLITWATLALALLLFARQQERQFAEQHTSDARKHSAAIAADLAQGMLAGGGSEVWTSLSADTVSQTQMTNAERILLFTAGGTVKAASESGAIGTRIEVKDNPECPNCDSIRPEDFPALGSISIAQMGRGLRIVSPIPISEACMRCHAQSDSARSFVAVDFDLGPVERGAGERRDAMLVMGLVAGFLVMVLTALLFRRLVMQSVDAISRSASRLASGDLTARVGLVGRNEIALLARNFNHMAERIEQQVADIAAAHTESELLYTLVVEASKNLETSEVAGRVSRVLLERLRPRQVAFFLESSDGGWTCTACTAGRDEMAASGEGVLEQVLATGAAKLVPLLAGMPVQIVADACRTQRLQLVRNEGGLTFALPVVADTRLIGLLVCIGIPAQIQAGEQLLQNLGGHLTLAAINSRNYTGAITDGLTRLSNKRYGMIRLEEAVYAAKRYATGLGLLMCDIDHFKRINDGYGHPAGDRVLREVARRISSCMRKTDVAVRYGGEEFMLVLPGAGPESLPTIGEKIRQAISATPIDLGTDGVSLALTASVGIAAFHAGGDSGEALIARADAALYRAKEGGRNRVELER